MTTTQTRPEVVRSQVEPRLAERRRRVLEAHHRRRRRRWIAAATVVLLVAAVVGAAVSPLLDVDRVVVVGTDRLSDDDVRRASGLEPGDHMVAVDLAAARRGVRDLSGVAAASVVRVWPDTVRVTVVEERPLLRVRAGDTEVVLSETGRVVGSDPAPADEAAVAGLPVLELVDTNGADPAALERTAAPVLVVYDRMPDALARTLALGRLDGDGELEFELADGATVRFGPVEDVPAKLVRVQAALEQVALECLARLDVATSRVTVSRTPGCTPPAPTEVDGSASVAPSGGTTAEDPGQ